MKAKLNRIEILVILVLILVILGLFMVLIYDFDPIVIKKLILYLQIKILDRPKII